ncbi:hypothetical protein [Lysobacter enzymogenes]|uniref:hypothetical protein n=1 Tax=Lysobacter enzymogenes TaxID=69 RepID=UPI0013040CFB|nr:hypothetical protein [Lysobacter enzymogenes]UZW62739.1 hypothetical protein BV903_010790 [Lysobacter enzymogenes]
MLNPGYKLVSLRATGTPPCNHEFVGLALDEPGSGAAEAHRFRLTLAEAERAALALLDAIAIQRYRASLCKVQSPIWSGSPSLEGSPQDGQSVCPPAKSSNACCGDS